MGRGEGKEKGEEWGRKKGVSLAPDDAKREQTCAAVLSYVRVRRTYLGTGFSATFVPASSEFALVRTRAVPSIVGS
jgi:hypothetical protein